MTRWLPTEQKTRGFGAAFFDWYFNCFCGQEFECQIAVDNQPQLEIELVLAFLQFRAARPCFPNHSLPTKPLLNETSHDYQQ